MDEQQKKAFDELIVDLAVGLTLAILLVDSEEQLGQLTALLDNTDLAVLERFGRISDPMSLISKN